LKNPINQPSLLKKKRSFGLCSPLIINRFTDSKFATKFPVKSCASQADSTRGKFFTFTLFLVNQTPEVENSFKFVITIERVYPDPLIDHKDWYLINQVNRIEAIEVI